MRSILSVLSIVIPVVSFASNAAAGTYWSCYSSDAAVRFDASQEDDGLVLNLATSIETTLGTVPRDYRPRMRPVVGTEGTYESDVSTFVGSGDTSTMQVTLVERGDAELRITSDVHWSTTPVVHAFPLTCYVD